MMFDRHVVINLDRRPDRLEAFFERFPASMPRPERIQALDGELIGKPDWFTQQPGAWGCLRTHIRLMEEALNNKQNIFIWEDDCVFVPDFSQRAALFFDNVPADWQMIYLGGLHRMPNLHPPVKVNDYVSRGRAITTTYAYGLRYEFLKVLYPLLLEAEQHHIDQMLARLQAANNWNIYCPQPWLVGMDAGQSDICNRYYQKPHFWEYTAATALEPIYLHQLLSRVELRNGVFHRVDLTSQQSRPAIRSSIGGWFSDECGAVYRRECRKKTGTTRLAEIGCWRGRSLSYLADLISSGDVEASAIDTWKGNSERNDPTHGCDVYESFIDNMHKLGIKDRLNIVRLPSLAASRQFEDEFFDVVMIDADHEESHVAADLRAWLPKVKPGGVLMGHDYSEACSCPGVVKAVDAFASEFGFEVESRADMFVIRVPEMAVV